MKLKWMNKKYKENGKRYKGNLKNTYKYIVLNKYVFCILK